MLAGTPASALESGPSPISLLELEYKGRFSTGHDIAQVRSMVAAPGQRGIVFGNRGPGKIGHVFNVANQNGVIKFFDGQIGAAPNLSGYMDFWFLRTK